MFLFTALSTTSNHGRYSINSFNVKTCISITSRYGRQQPFRRRPLRRRRRDCSNSSGRLLCLAVEVSRRSRAQEQAQEVKYQERGIFADIGSLNAISLRTLLRSGIGRQTEAHTYVARRASYLPAVPLLTSVLNAEPRVNECLYLAKHRTSLYISKLQDRPCTK